MRDRYTHRESSRVSSVEDIAPFILNVKTRNTDYQYGGWLISEYICKISQTVIEVVSRSDKSPKIEGQTVKSQGRNRTYRLQIIGFQRVDSGEIEIEIEIEPPGI
jgi:hypothetical protein